MSAASTIIAVLVGVVLGLAVLVYVRNTRRERRLAAEMALATAVDASAVPSAPPFSLTASAPDAGMLIVGDIDDDPLALDAAVAPSEVTLRVPPRARLFVDGRQLPAGTDTVARPDAGILSVLVRADGYQDALVEITPTSLDEIEVPMVEKPKPKPRPAAPSPDPASTIAMPPNPYE